MQILKLEIENCFQHKEFTAEFSPFTSVVGPNGTGKSNIISSIRYGLTGDMGLPGNKDTMISYGEEKGSVKLEVEHEGEVVQIRAVAGKANRSLKRPGLDIKAAKDCMQYHEAVLLRTPFSVVNEASIVGQGKLDSGLFDPPSQRTQTFMRLAGMMEIEAKREILAQELRRVSVPLFSLDLETERAKLEEKQARKNELERELNELSNRQIDVDAYQAAQVTIGQAEQIAQAQKDVEPLQKEKVDLEELEAEIDQTVKAELEQEQSLTSWLDENQKAYQDNLRAQTERSIQVERWRKKELLTANLEKLEKQRQDLREPEPRVDQPINDWRTALSDARSALEMARKIISSMSVDRRCPIFGVECKTVDVEQATTKAKKDVEELTSLIEEITGAIAEEEQGRLTYQQAVSKYESALAVLESSFKHVQANYDEVKDAVEPEPFETFDRAIAEYEEKKQALRKLQDDLRRDSGFLAETRTKLAEKANKLVVALAKLGGEIDVKAVEEARVFVAETDKLLSRKQFCLGGLETLQKEIESQLQSLQKMEERSVAQAKFSNYVKIIEAARGALHRDNFPAGKVRQFIERTLVGVNRYLEIMQARFLIDFDWDRGFEARFPNKVQRADRLSGGEKVIFALAFRFAVNEMSSSTGFLILDEPTVYLDQHHVGAVADALELVKRRMCGRVQVVVVTHDERVANVADSIVRLS